jgi:hypothetical protein
LKANNIIYDELRGKPIIIDFGLSFDTSLSLPNDNDSTATIQWEKLVDVFYIYEDYPAWCFEINVLNYIMNKMEPKWYSDTMLVITDSIVTMLCSDFIKNSQLLTNYFSADELASFQERLIKYMSGFIGKPFVVLATELLKSYSTWDNYSLAVIYYGIIKTNHLDVKDVMNISFFKDFLQLLQQTIIFALPHERKSVDDIVVEFRGLTNKILKKDKKNINKSLQIVNKSDEYARLQLENHSRVKLHDLHREKIIYHR